MIHFIILLESFWGECPTPDLNRDALYRAMGLKPIVAAITPVGQRSYVDANYSNLILRFLFASTFRGV